MSRVHRAGPTHGRHRRRGRPHRHGRRRHSGSESGFVAGAEAVAFGVLVVLGATLAVLHAWAAVQVTAVAHGAAEHAATVAAGRVTDADVAAHVTEAAHLAARAHGHDGGLEVGVQLPGAAVRCGRVRVTVTASVASPLAGRELTAERSAVRRIDPYRDGLEVDATGAGCGS